MYPDAYMPYAYYTYTRSCVKCVHYIRYAIAYSTYEYAQSLHARHVHTHIPTCVNRSLRYMLRIWTAWTWMWIRANVRTCDTRINQIPARTCQDYIRPHALSFCIRSIHTRHMRTHARSTREMHSMMRAPNCSRDHAIKSAWNRYAAHTLYVNKGTCSTYGYGQYRTPRG
jgi:hypothetical protein